MRTPTASMQAGGSQAHHKRAAAATRSTCLMSLAPLTYLRQPLEHDSVPYLSVLSLCGCHLYARGWSVTRSVKCPHRMLCLSRNCPRRKRDSQKEAATMIFSHLLLRTCACFAFNADALGWAASAAAAAAAAAAAVWTFPPL